MTKNFDKLKQAQKLKERKIEAGRKKDNEGKLQATSYAPTKHFSIYSIADMV